MEQIRDMLYVKTIERRIKRRLSEEEMDGQPFTVRRPNGLYEEFCVPLLNFPWDVVTKIESIPGPANKLVKMSAFDDQWMKRWNVDYTTTIWDDPDDY